MLNLEAKELEKLLCRRSSGSAVKQGGGGGGQVTPLTPTSCKHGRGGLGDGVRRNEKTKRRKSDQPVVENGTEVREEKGMRKESLALYQTDHLGGPSLMLSNCPPPQLNSVDTALGGIVVPNGFRTGVYQCGSAQYIACCSIAHLTRPAFLLCRTVVQPA